MQKKIGISYKVKKISELILYAEQFRDNKSFHDKYKKSKDPDRYLRMHETQLILYDGAERMLQKMGLDPKSVNAAEIRADYETMQARKAALEKTYKSAEKEAQALQQKLAKVEQYLGQDKEKNQSHSQKEISSKDTNRS